MSAVLERLSGEIKSTSGGIPRLGFRQLLPISDEYAHINLIQIPLGGGETLMVGRRIPRARVVTGTPDFNKVVLFKKSSDGVRFLNYLKIPDPDGQQVDNWEDARWDYADRGRFRIAWTALTPAQDPKRKGEFDPHPALTFAHLDPLNETDPLAIDEVHVFSNYIGKNFVPISVAKPEDINRYLFRLDEDNSAFYLMEFKEGELKIVKRIEMPSTEYSKKRPGINFRDILLANGNRLLIDHGVNDEYIQVLDPKSPFLYSYEVFSRYGIGATILTRDWDVLKRTQKPLRTRESYADQISLDQELSSLKSAIYSVDRRVFPEGVDLDISVGDLVPCQDIITTEELSKALDEEIVFAGPFDDYENDSAIAA